MKTYWHRFLHSVAFFSFFFFFSCVMIATDIFTWTKSSVFSACVNVYGHHDSWHPYYSMHTFCYILDLMKKTLARLDPISIYWPSFHIRVPLWSYETCQPFYVDNGNFYTGKITYLFWDIGQSQGLVFPRSWSTLVQILVNIGSGNKPSSEPMLTQISVAIWHHQATMS